MRIRLESFTGDSCRFRAFFILFYFIFFLFKYSRFWYTFELRFPPLAATTEEEEEEEEEEEKVHLSSYPLPSLLLPSLSQDSQAPRTRMHIHGVFPQCRLTVYTSWMCVRLYVCMCGVVGCMCVCVGVTYMIGGRLICSLLSVCVFMCVCVCVCNVCLFVCFHLNLAVATDRQTDNQRAHNAMMCA